MGIGFGKIDDIDTNQMQKIMNELDSLKDKKLSKGTIRTIFSTSNDVNTGQERLITFSQMLRLYKLNEWVRAVVDRTVNKIVSYNPIISIIGDKKTQQAKNHQAIAEALFQNPNKTKDSWFQVRKKALRDILVYDAGGLVKIQSKRGGEDDILARGKEISKANLELMSIAGDTIYLDVDSSGLFKDIDKSYYQMIDPSKDKKKWYAANELIYMLDNPIAGYVYGLSPLETLVLAVTAELYASTFNRDFFKNDATPRLGILFDDMGTDPTAKLKRFQQYWNNELKGKPHKPIFMGTSEGKVRIEKVGMSNTDMQFMEYSHWLLSKILAVYKCQPFVLGDILPTTGKLNSEQQSEQWYEDAIRPMLELETYYYNTEIIWAKSGLGFDDIIYHYPKASFNKKEDEEIDRGQIKDGRLFINEWRQERGLEPVDWGNAPWFSANVQQPGTLPPDKQDKNKAKSALHKHIQLPGVPMRGGLVKKKNIPNFLKLK